MARSNFTPENSRPPLKIGLSLHRLHFFGYNPDSYISIARKAEELGFESIWVGDHLVFPTTIPATYPYSPTGRGPHRPDLPWFDPLISLTYLAASTQRIKLATDVYLLPLRNPFVTAKSVSTLDLLTGGRVILGVGVGWLETEFKQVGEDFGNRGKRTDETIGILRRLWTEDIIEHQGPAYSFGPVHFEPKPVQRPVPIHVGGISAAAKRRAALLGDGWIGVGSIQENVAKDVEEVRHMRLRAGLEGHSFEITLSASNPTVDRLQELYEMGVDRVTVIPWPWPEPEPPFGLLHAIDGMERFASDIIAKL